jgi:hypothetical protein
MDGLVVVVFVAIGLACVAHGYYEQRNAGRAKSLKREARLGNVLGTKQMVVASASASDASDRVDLKKVAVGMTLLDLGLDPKRHDHWITAERVVDAQLEQLDEVELPDRGLLHVSDVDTDPVIELPFRDPVEISEVDGVTI